ncbi:hypothetical protein HU200_057427 [Digitaria exilis]|uniref:Uncharacterized protein n=1 Tax=Digitaria exilis TaxID=1010633 RepID=A0A835ABA7_9POAL|nr:hypothetical protein HU200_057427 [Digitaria exilis]
MISPPWNKILRALPRFVVIRSNHDGGPTRTLDLVSLLLRWQKQNGERCEKEDDAQFRLQECWPSFIGLWHYFWLSRLWRTKATCLCSHPYEPSHRFGIEFWSYMLSDLGCNLFGLQTACNMSMYSTTERTVHV